MNVHAPYFLNLRMITGYCVTHGPYSYFVERDRTWQRCLVCEADILRGKLRAIREGDVDTQNMLRFYE